MGIIKVQEKEKLEKLFWNSSRYYDYPDGQDLIGKLKYTNKMAGLVGSFIGLVAVHGFRPVPVSLKEKLLRYFQIFLPSLGVATVFTCVTYFSTNFRKKDDEFNYVLGAVSAGTLLIPASGKVSFGVSAAVLFAAVGYFKKTMQLNNSVLFPPIMYRQKSTYYDRHTDISLEKNTIRSGNWIKK